MMKFSGMLNGQTDGKTIQELKAMKQWKYFWIPTYCLIF
jgi:hypothetical protein